MMDNVPRAAIGGAVAGAVGTLAMDLLWFRRARQDGTRESFTEWEFTDATTFEDAGAPAQVGDTVASAAGIEIPEDRAGTATDAVHWATGLGWGVVGSVVGSAMRWPPVITGVASGAAAFAGAYTILPALGIYDPIWDYDAKTLWKDASAHATFGLAAGVTLSVLDRLPRPSER